MRKIVALIVLAVAGVLFAQEPEETPRELYVDVCAQCHELSGYVWERSFKSWQACVYQMQAYSGGSFSDEEADVIVDFLTEHAGSIERELEAEEQGLVVVEEQVLAVTDVEPTFVPPRRDRAVFDFSAKVSGYAGFGFLLLAVGSGACRRRLKRAFKWLHRVAAGMVMLTVLLHSVYFLKTLGLPHLLWFVMGVVSTGVLLVTAASGWFRRRLRWLFIKTHVTAALVALLAAIFHWIWIYI